MTKWLDGLPDDDGFDRYGDSPYYSPPEGLEIFADVDIHDEPYEFHQVVIWKDTKTGELLGAADSGCSCPTPFGDLTREGMKPITNISDLDSLFESLYAPGEEGQRVGLFKEKVRSALNDR